jgi:hypothetical protein
MRHFRLSFQSSIAAWAVHLGFLMPTHERQELLAVANGGIRLGRRRRDRRRTTPAARATHQRRAAATADDPQGAELVVTVH